MRWSVAALPRAHPHNVPHLPAPGTISVWRAAPCHGFDTQASQGNALPEGHGDGDGALDHGSSCTPRFSAMLRRVGGPRVHDVVCAVLHSFLGAPGLQLV